MKFCPDCGKVLMPKEGEEKLKCPSCDYESEAGEDYTKSEEIEKTEGVVNIEEGTINLPKEKNTCPECGNLEAYFWVEQTRSADEAPTRFYKCTKCKHTWREYS